MSSLFHKVDSEASYQQWFKDGNEIASGSFASVFQVINLENDKVVAAIKRSDLSKLDLVLHEYSRREVKFLSFFDQET